MKDKDFEEVEKKVNIDCQLIKEGNKRINL